MAGAGPALDALIGRKFAGVTTRHLVTDFGKVRLRARVRLKARLGVRVGLGLRLRWLGFGFRLGGLGLGV